MARRLLLRAATALLLGLRASASAAQSEVLLLAPADADASLTAVRGLSSSRQWAVKAPHGGILVLHSTSVDVAVPGIDLANLSSMQVTWVPRSAPVSSTFEHVLGAWAPSSLPFLFSAGVHVQMATGSDNITEAGRLLDALVEAAPAALHRLLPNALAQNVLARSLCASTGFTRHHSSDQRVCFAASFELTEDAAVPQSQAWDPSHALLVGSRPRLTAVTLRTATQSPSHLTVDVLSVFVTPSGSLDGSALRPTEGTELRVMALEQIDSNRASIFSFDSGTVTTEDLPQATAAVQGELAVSVLGEGFHRRVQVELAGEIVCASDDTSNAKALVVVPLSTTMYADLDELRRMERFGDLQLHSPTKHIEIERPVAVSAQHVVALEFAIDKHERRHTLEFPIHLRYQSPSNLTYFAPATLVVPDVFISCGIAQEPTQNGLFDQIFPRWTDEDGWKSTSWRRVVPPSSLTHVSVPVPIGFTPHGSIVSAITLSVTGLGALLLVYVAVTAPKRTSETASTWKPKTA